MFEMDYEIDYDYDYEMTLEEKFQYVQTYDEYNHMMYNPEPAREIIDEIYDEYEDILRDCVDLSKDSEYQNLMLECYDKVDDMKYFGGNEDHFFELLENLEIKVDEIVKLLSAKDDELSKELLDMLDDATPFGLYY
jgi:hypothetical protein